MSRLRVFDPPRLAPYPADGDPVNVKISWIMMTNNNDDNADKGNDSQDSLLPMQTATTMLKTLALEMTMVTMPSTMIGTTGGKDGWRYKRKNHFRMTVSTSYDDNNRNANDDNSLHR